MKSHRFCISQKKMGVGGREGCFDLYSHKKSVAIHVQLFTLIIHPFQKKQKQTYYIRFKFLILHLMTE